jgi:drug/metabolite transporter (DMT)-like permease
MDRVCDRSGMERRALVLLGVLAALWGASYMFIKIAVEDDMSAATIVFVRTALAALALLPIALRRGAFAGLRPLLPLGIVLALVQVAIPFVLISAGEKHVSSGLAGVLVAAAPIFTAILAPFVDRSELSHGRALGGVIIGIVGVALVLGVDLGDAGAQLVGGLMILLASLGYAIGGFMVKARFKPVDPIGLVTMTMAISAIATLPFAAATAPDHFPSAGASAALLALGIGGTGIAFVIFYTLIANLGPARASLVAYIAPAFAIFYGATLQDEDVTVTTIAGLLLIVGGSWLAGRRPAAAAPAARAVPDDEPVACPEPVA